jgi:hypothetical protein
LQKRFLEHVTPPTSLAEHHNEDNLLADGQLVPLVLLNHKNTLIIAFEFIKDTFPAKLRRTYEEVTISFWVTEGYWKSPQPPNFSVDNA